jgi:hypothetical protein
VGHEAQVGAGGSSWTSSTHSSDHSYPGFARRDEAEAVDAGGAACDRPVSAGVEGAVARSRRGGAGNTCGGCGGRRARCGRSRLRATRPGKPTSGRAHQHRPVNGVDDSHIEDGLPGTAVGCIRNFSLGGSRTRQELRAHSDLDRYFTYASCDPFTIDDDGGTARTLHRYEAPCGSTPSPTATGRSRCGRRATSAPLLTPPTGGSGGRSPCPLGWARCATISAVASGLRRPTTSGVPVGAASSSDHWARR